MEQTTIMLDYSDYEWEFVKASRNFEDVSEYDEGGAGEEYAYADYEKIRSSEDVYVAVYSQEFGHCVFMYADYEVQFKDKSLNIEDFLS